ncbi:unnamed protein product, partial [Meganyctiphanes norvegica]
MRVPETPSAISEEWVEYVLMQYATRDNLRTSINVNHIKVENALNTDDGFDGQLAKVYVKATVSEESAIQKEEEYHLIVKITEADSSCRLLNCKFGNPHREYIAYSNAFYQLNRFQEKIGNNEYFLKIPNYYYGKCINDIFILVMDNLKP